MLLQNPLLTEAAGEDDLTMANALLAAHGPQQIAAAFVKLYRAQLPAPEDISEAPQELHRSKGPSEQRRDQARKHGKPESQMPRDSRPVQHGHAHKDQPRTPHKERGPREPMGALANGPWFLLNVGRERNADPKWLLPEICRQGEVTKADIGAIRVYDRETRFQVDTKVAEKFAALVAARQKGGVRIFPAPGNHGDASPPRPDHKIGPKAGDKPGFEPGKKPRWKGKKKFAHSKPA